MVMGDDTSFLDMGQGCPIHGDEYLKECAMCGAEFCQLCFPKSSVCPECAAVNEEVLEDEDIELSDPDFDDVDDLDAVLDDDFGENEKLDEK